MSKRLQAAITACLLSASAEAGLTTAASTCNQCTNYSDLSTQALRWESITHVPAYLTMVSLNAPVAGTFWVFMVCIPPLNICSPRSIPVTGAGCTTVQCWDAAVSRQDNIMFARSIKSDQPITIETPFSWNALPSSVSLTIENTITFTGQSGVEPYHLVTGFIGDGWSVSYWNYLVPPYTYPIQIFAGDMITATYPGGFTERFEFQGADVTKANRWTRVPGTLMRYGKPYTPPSTAPATPAPNFGNPGGTDNWCAANECFIQVYLDPHLCYGTSTVAVVAPDGTSVEGTSAFSAGCP